MKCLNLIFELTESSEKNSDIKPLTQPIFYETIFYELFISRLNEQ